MGYKINMMKSKRVVILLSFFLVSTVINFFAIGPFLVMATCICFWNTLSGFLWLFLPIFFGLIVFSAMWLLIDKKRLIYYFAGVQVLSMVLMIITYWIFFILFFNWGV
jgi:hypothetical protein